MKPLSVAAEVKRMSDGPLVGMDVHVDFHAAFLPVCFRMAGHAFEPALSWWRHGFTGVSHKETCRLLLPEENLSLYLLYRLR